MDLFLDIFNSIVGKANFMLFVGKHPVAKIDIDLDKKEVIAELMSPVALLTLGLEELISKKGLKDIELIKRIKEAGYVIKVKYKSLEIDI
ncbi:MAG: hypothetical protein QW625_03595 [Candidatus Nanoarchaeia archaeon]